MITLNENLSITEKEFLLIVEKGKIHKSGIVYTALPYNADRYRIGATQNGNILGVSQCYTLDQIHKVIEKKSKRLNNVLKIKFNDADYLAIMQRAEEEGTNMSEVIRRAVQNYLGE